MLNLIFNSFQLAVYPVGWSTDWSLFMGIIIYSYKALSRIVIKFGAYIYLWFPYTCAKFQPDQSMCYQVRGVFVQKELEEKNKKIKIWRKNWNFGGLLGLKFFVISSEVS